MALVSEQLPNLMNGVSQQAVTMRLTSQAAEQLNGLSSVVEGVNKRPPSKHLAKIIDGLPGNAFVYTINRDTTERYVVVILNGSIRVFDLDGVEQTVTYPGGTGYITEASPKDAFRAMTLGDTTFIVNRNTTVATLPATTPARTAYTMLFVKGVNYSVNYQVRLDGTEIAAWQAPNADTVGAKIGTDRVVNNLYDALTTAAPAGYTFTKQDNIILIEQTSGTPGIWEFDDDFAGVYTETVREEMESFADLPTTAQHGFETAIIGTASDASTAYYLRFENEAASGIGQGIWVESAQPGVETQLDPATMPHILARVSAGVFELQQAPWGERTVGDIDSAPWPSFVGATISDAYYDRNRLCFLSGGNISMSRSRALYENFRTTATALLDDGPIDITAPGTRTPTLRSAIPFNEEVIVFGDQTQYTIDTDTLRASVPPEMKVITDYETDSRTVPVAVGRTMYFPVDRGAWTAVMEYYVVEDSDTTDATDVTKHVPNYIPAGTFKLAASPTSNVLLALSEGSPNSIYVYKYMWRGNEKLQSSWSEWSFGDGAEILNVDFIKDIAYFVVQYPDGVYLQSIDVSDGQADENADFVYRLDRRVDETDVTMSYDALLDRTTVTLPYIPTTPSGMVAPVRPKTGNTLTAGSVITIESINGADVVLIGDATSEGFYIGETYEFRYRFSQAVLKSGSQSGGLATITGGRLQILRWLMTYEKTGYFRAVVEAANRQAYTYAYTGKILGTSKATIGRPTVGGGTFGFGVKSRSDRVQITIINDSFLPSFLTAAEWEGRYERRTGR